MDIAVVHHSLNIPGGAEKLCLAVIEALKGDGHKVTLATVEKTDWKVVKRNFGDIFLPDRETYLTKLELTRKLSNTPMTATYFLGYLLQLLLKKSGRKHDVVINTFGDVVNSLADITYIHFPLRAALQYSQIPAFSNASTWRVIAPVYSAALSLLDRVSPGNLLTNSQFMQTIIENVLHRKPVIIYPPVDVETIRSQYTKTPKSSSLVATISSYTPKRRLEQVPLIAKHAKKAKFVIMGKADEYSSPIFKKLNRLRKTLDVKDRVTLQTNVPKEVLFKTLSRANVYLHVMPTDHFGISVVEAMAAGCVPVVHRSGGPWLDILDMQQGEYGFSYTSAEEAADIINKLVSDENLRGGIAPRTLYRARQFDKSIFIKKMIDLVKNLDN